MDNANFGFDCRNNASNTKLITYIKKYYNLFDSQVANFVTSQNKTLTKNMSKKW